jgi:WD40 repeat protein
MILSQRSQQFQIASMTPLQADDSSAPQGRRRSNHMRIMNPFVSISVMLCVSICGPRGYAAINASLLPPGATLRIGDAAYRHPEPLEAIAFTHGGRDIITIDAGLDNSLSTESSRHCRIWNLATRKKVASLSTRAALGRQCVSFSGDCKWMATMPSILIIEIWNLETITKCHEIDCGRLGFTRRQEDGVVALKLSFDGKYLVMWNDKRGALLLSIDSGLIVAKIPKSQGLQSVCFSRDCKTVAYCFQDRIAISSLSQVLGLRTNVVRLKALSVAFGRDSNELYIISDESKIRIWDVNRGTLRVVAEIPLKGLRRCLFSDDFSTIAISIDTSPNVFIYQTSSGKPISRIVVPVGMRANGFAFSPYGKTMAVIVGNQARFFDAANGNQVLADSCELCEPIQVAFDQESKHLISADRNGLQLWSRVTGKRVDSISFAGNRFKIEKLVSANGLHVAGSDSGGLYFVRAVPFGVLDTIFLDKGIEAIAEAPQGRILVVTRNSIRSVGRGPSGGLASIQIPLKVQQSFGQPVALESRGEAIAFARRVGEGGRCFDVEVVTLASLRSAALIRTSIIRNLQMAFIRGGAGLVVTGLTYRGDYETSAWNWRSNCVIWSKRESGRNAGGASHGLIVSPDSRVIAMLNNSIIGLFEAASGERICTLSGHDDRVTSACFSYDSKELVSGSADNTIIVWNTWFGGATVSGRKGIPVEFVVLWHSLAGPAREAWPAMASLATLGTRAVVCLEQELRPAPAANKNKVRKILDDLDASLFDTREAASNEIGHLSREEVEYLLALGALSKSPEVAARMRIGRELLNGESKEDLQKCRAIQVLERIGTSRALALIEKLAGGEELSIVTREAKASLKGIERRGK